MNHQGTIHVLDAALASGAERILHVSTESILTRARSTGPIAEDVEIALTDAVGPYCRSKLRAENHAMDLARDGCPGDRGQPDDAGRPGRPGGLAADSSDPRFLQRRLPARMDCTLNLIDVRDVARGLVRAMDRGRPARRYLLGGENLTLLALLGHLSELTGVPVPRWSVPYPVGLAVAFASEAWADLISGNPPKATVTGVRLTRRTMHFDADATASANSISNLGRSDESLADAVAWLRETHAIGEAPVRPGTVRPG